MTLDEAIKHAEEKENEAQDLEYSKLDWRHESNQCSECAKEHHQLAKWLKDYKRLLKNDLAVDCISRQFMYELGATCIATRNKNDNLIALGAIEELPSVTPIRPKGHWIEHEHNGKSYIECSECLCWFLREHLLRNSYCSNCGSDNREVVEE